MRSRAAILPFSGDPFLLTYWLHFFDTVWGDEIDTLYIYLNATIETSVVEYIRSLCMDRGKINFTYNPHQVEHGYAIDRILSIVQEEFVMLIEDDGFIFKPGKVNEFFEAIESGQYDIVGSKRGSCSVEIWDRAKILYNLNYAGDGDQGPNFWPNFFFTRKSLLLRINRNFGARAWKPGEEIIPLSRPGDPFYAKELVTSDTFVEASMHLLNIVPQNRILYVPQYHGSPDDLEHYQRSYNLFDGRAWWCHIGSLSSGVGGVLQDAFGRPLARRLIDPEKENPRLPGKPNTDQERHEWERRIQWFKRFYEYFGETQLKNANADMQEFYKLYGEAIERVIREYELSDVLIKRRQNIYRTIGL